MEHSTGISATWSQLTSLQKKLIIIIICLGITLVCLICVTTFLIVRNDIRLVHCQQKKQQLPVVNRIVQKRKHLGVVNNASTTKDEEFAKAKIFIVSLHYKHAKGRDTAYCVGSIVSRHWFITSSLCLHQNIKKKNLYARAGSLYHDKGGSIHPVINFEIPDWRRGDTDYYTYRYISLAEVSRPFIIDNNLIVPAMLPKQYNNEERFVPNYNLFTFGWGTYISTEVKPKYKKLRIMTSNIYYTSASCKNYLQVDELKALRIIENILCAGDIKAPSNDQCNIDAGAPLTHLGIISGVSWSGTSCKNHPTVYSKVCLFVNWTLSYTKNDSV